MKPVIIENYKNINLKLKEYISLTCILKLEQALAWDSTDSSIWNLVGEQIQDNLLKHTYGF